MQPDDRSLFSLVQIQHLMRVEFNRARRHRYPLSCLLISIDRLGHLRDVHGYEAKEAIVRSVVEALKAVTSQSDFLGRTADDRLMAVVPHTDVDGAKRLAERLMERVTESPLEVGGKPVSISLSIGFSHNMSGDTLYFDALLEAARRALNEASDAGGGACVLRAPGAS
jgi:diguanylate cyclase (GGDEF)-like protein